MRQMEKPMRETGVSTGGTWASAARPASTSTATAADGCEEAMTMAVTAAPTSVPTLHQAVCTIVTPSQGEFGINAPAMGSRLPCSHGEGEYAAMQSEAAIRAAMRALISRRASTEGSRGDSFSHSGADADAGGRARSRRSAHAELDAAAAPATPPPSTSTTG